LIAYQGPGTAYTGSTVGAIQDAGLVNSGASSSSTIDVFSVFDALTVGVGGVGQGYAPSAGDAVSVVSHQASTREAALAKAIANNSTAARSVGDSTLALDGAMGRSFAERTTTLAAADAEAAAAVDQVLGTLPDTNADDTLIGDLAFEQVTSGMHKPRGGVNAIDPLSGGAEERGGRAVSN
jgi:hypothetical protein